MTRLERVVMAIRQGRDVLDWAVDSMRCRWYGHQPAVPWSKRYGGWRCPRCWAELPDPDAGKHESASR